MHRRGRTWLLALVALAVLTLGAWSQASAPQTQAADDPVDVVQAFVAAANEAIPAGDGEALAARFTEDGYLFDISNGSFGVIGREALAFGFSEEPDPDFHATVTEISADGNTVTGTAEVVDSGAVAAGVDRYVQHLTAVVDGDLIASTIFTYDESDAQTAAYLAYQDSADEDDDELPPGTVIIAVHGNQPGTAYLTSFGGPPVIFAEIQPGDAGVWQPAAIYNGTCDALGSVVSILAPFVDGSSGSFFSGFTVDGLVDGDYAIGIAASPDNPVIVACGDIEPAAAPAPTPTGGTQLPNTGSGPMSGSDFGWPLAALVAVGAAALAGSGAMRLSMRRR